MKQISIGNKLSPLALRQIEKIVDQIAEQFEKKFSSKFQTFFNYITNVRVTLLTEMTQDNYWSTFGMLIYGRCGNLIRELLDNQKQQIVSISQIADLFSEKD